MLPPNEYILTEAQRIHRQELMNHAAQARLAHHFRSLSPTWFDRGMALLGRVLVRCGRRLEMRAPIGLNGVQS